MAYKRVIKNYLPYMLMKDKRGFISLQFGVNGHTGIDSVGNEYSNPVCAIVNGKVLAVYKSATLGNVVEYGYSNVKIAYYHMAASVVKVGQTVKAGVTKIGTEGCTGSLCKGKHLHVSMWIDGKLVNPEPYLASEKDIPKEKKGVKYMIRRVTSALNLRSSRDLSSNKNIVYSNMPVGTEFLVTDTVTEGDVTWGKIFTVIKGESYAGWCNLGETWSSEVK